MGFTWRVAIDGADIAGLVPDGEATIEYGRQQETEQPTPTTATITLITPDAPDYTAQMGSLYPEFTLGDQAIKSGFVDPYEDRYEGALTRVRLNTPVVIGADTPSGFRDEYVDGYNDGLNLTRFTGHIVAIDYGWDRIRLTCISALGALTRQNTLLNNLPAETDVARVARIAPTITIEGQPSVDLAAIPDDPNTKPVDVYRALVNIAEDAQAVVWDKRDGSIGYRSRFGWTPAKVTLPPEATLMEPLEMTAELGLVINQVAVEFGPKTARETVTLNDSDSITLYGLRDATYSTALATQQDAEDYAQDMLTRYSRPHWSMPAAEVNLGMTTDKAIAAVAALDLGDEVTVPHLLPGSPMTSYTASCLGYSESLSPTDWTMTIHLTPSAKPISRSAA